jgi:hypothetical protein
MKSKSDGGIFRQRRANRRLEMLAEDPFRTSDPTAAATHVRLLDAPGAPGAPAGPAAAVEADGPLDQGDRPPPDLRPSGFHVKAVPIDQPFSQA